MSDSRTSWSACDHLGDARGQAVVVAEADLGGRDGVVLVDHRNAAEAEQRGQGGARVEVAAAVLGVVQRQQQLGGGEALRGQRLAPGLRQADLADGGGGLLLLQPQARLRAGRARGGPARWRPRRPRSPRRRARAARRCRRRRRRARRCGARPRPGPPPARCRSSRPGAGRRRARGHARMPSRAGGGGEGAVMAAPPPASPARGGRVATHPAAASIIAAVPQHLRHALAGHAGHQHDRPPGCLRQRRPRAPRPRAGVIASALFSPISSGLSARPPP